MLNSKTTRLFYILLFLVAIGFNLYLRLFPAFLPQLIIQAKINTEKEIFKKAEKALKEKLSAYEPRVKSRIIKEAVITRKKDKKYFKAKVAKEYEKLKDKYQDESGQTYLLEVDPYAWMRFTRLTLKNGYPGDKKIKGRVYDTFALAPEGRSVPSERFLFYFSAFSYKITSLILPALRLKNFLFYFPVFLTFIFFIFLYFFVKHFFSKLAAILAILFVGLSRMFIMRSCAGWFDMDVLNLFFPLIIFWCLASAHKYKKTSINILLSAIAGLFLSLFAYTWLGWRFVFVVVGIFFIYFILNNILLYFKDIERLKKETYPYIISLAAFAFANIIFCLIFLGIEPFSNTFKWVLGSLGLTKTVGEGIWPNVFSTVGEFTKGNFLNIPHSMLGVVPLVLSIASLLWIYIKEKRSKRAEMVILLVFWTFCSFFVSFQATRFTLFLSLSLGIFFAVGLDEFLSLSYLKLKNVRSIKAKVSYLFVGAIGLYLIFFPIVKRSFLWASQMPMMNDARYDFFTKMKDKTPQDSVINAWWDYGNWIKEVSERKVIFDPQTQDGPLSYWMAKALLAENEDKALRILRMLNNSSDKLFNEVSKHTGNDFKAIAILEEILSSDYDASKIIAKKYGLSKKLTETIQEFIFLKEPDQSYFLVDKTLLIKMHAISYLSNWDFKKVFINKQRSKSKESVVNELSTIFSLATEEAKKIYDETTLSLFISKEKGDAVSKRWSFVISPAKGQEKDGIVFFDNGVILNLKNKEATLFIQGKHEKFKNIMIFDEGKLGSKHNENTDLQWSLLVIKEEEDGNIIWKCVGMSSEKLGRSLFSRLYFMKAKELKFFEPLLLDDVSGFYAFKIKWPKVDN